MFESVLTIAALALLALGLYWMLSLPSHTRARRIKRGLCPKCAYSIGVSDLCSECGAAVELIPNPKT